MSDAHSNEPKRRPLLAYGERLSEKAARPGRKPDKFHPFTAEQAWEILAPKAVDLSNRVRHLPPETRGRHVVFEATLLPNYVASSYSPAEMLDKAGLYVVGARTTQERLVTANQTKDAEPTKTLLIAGRPDRVTAFADFVAQRPTRAEDKTWERIRQFSDLGLARPERVARRRPVLAQGEVITWEAVLTHVFEDPRNEGAWADENFAKWVDYVRSLGGTVDDAYRRDVEHLTFVPVELAGEALDDATRFNLLRAIRPMPTLRPFPDDVLRMFPGSTVPSRAAAEGRVPEITIATFDGGVNPNLALLRPFVKAFDLTPEAPDQRAMKHGTLVSSALLYGSISAGSTLPDPHACVHHYRVLPAPQMSQASGLGSDRSLYWILDQIVDTIRAEKYSLVSLSIGPNEPVEEGHEPTRWTSELDLLAHDHGVTFVAAVGNNGEEDASLGYNRVMSPGDMVNGICVGATATTDRRKIVRASYSAVGPGREGQRVAPTGLAFGGSAMEPFVGIDASGRLANTAGTSFAAPSAARAIASLWSVISGDRRRPAQSRAFAVHFAQRRSRGHNHLELGHGLFPEEFGRLFECAANEVTVLYEDQLPRTDIIAMRFPFPDGLVPDAEIVAEWTMAYVSSVDPSDASDYAQHGLDVTFRPNEALRSLTMDDGQRREVDTRRDGVSIQAALAMGGRLSDVPVSHSSWRPTTEAALRARGKWETVVRGRVRMSAEELYRPRLDVQHLQRADGRLVNGSNVPPLPIAMLLTIRGPEGLDLYDRTSVDFPVLAPLVQVPVRLPGVA